MTLVSVVVVVVAVVVVVVIVVVVGAYLELHMPLDQRCSQDLEIADQFNLALHNLGTDVQGLKKKTSLKTNMTLENPPFFHMKYIIQMVDFPLSSKTPGIDGTSSYSYTYYIRTYLQKQKALFGGGTYLVRQGVG